MNLPDALNRTIKGKKAKTDKGGQPKQDILKEDVTTHDSPQTSTCDFFFDSPSSTKETEIELNLIEDLYASSLLEKDETYWLCNSAKGSLVVCVREMPPFGWKGVAVSYQRTYAFETGSKTGQIDELIQISLQELSLEPVDLIRIYHSPPFVERVKQLFSPNRLGVTVAVAYCQKGQAHRSQILQNTLEDCSKSFHEFLEALAEMIPDMKDFPHFTGGQYEGVGFYRHFRNKLDYIYHVAPYMKEDNQRQFIGNDRVLVIYFDQPPDITFDYSCLESFGSVPQSFILAQPAPENKIRLTFLSKKSLAPHLPKTPTGPLSLADAVNFIHLKAYNSIVETNFSPPFDKLFFQPRRHQIAQIFEEFFPKKPLALEVPKRPRGLFSKQNRQETSLTEPKSSTSRSETGRPTSSSFHEPSTSHSSRTNPIHSDLQRLSLESNLRLSTTSGDTSHRDRETDNRIDLTCIVNDSCLFDFGEFGEEDESPQSPQSGSDSVKTPPSTDRQVQEFLSDLGRVDIPPLFIPNSLTPPLSPKPDTPKSGGHLGSPNLRKARSARPDYPAPDTKKGVSRRSPSPERKIPRRSTDEVLFRQSKPKRTADLSPSPESKKNRRPTKEIRLIWLVTPQFSSWKKCLDFHYCRLKDTHLNRFRRFFHIFLHGLGVPITTVYSVYNPPLTRLFNTERDKMRNKIARDLKQDFLHDSAKAWVHDEYMKRVELFEWNQTEPTPILPVLCGTDWDTAVKFCATGFPVSDLTGALGQGLCFSSNAKYLTPYFSLNQPTLILSFALPGNVFPMTSDQISGPLHSKYQSRYAITSSSGTISTTNTEGCDEFVFGQENQLLPAYLLCLNENKLKTLSQWIRPISQVVSHDSEEIADPFVDSDEDAKTDDHLLSPPRTRSETMSTTDSEKEPSGKSDDPPDYPPSKYYQVTPLRLWTLDQTSTWLASLGFDLDIAAWRRHKVDGLCLSELSDFNFRNELKLTMVKSAKIKHKRGQILAQQQETTFEHIPVAEWTVDHVCGWAESISLGPDVLAKEGVTGETLLVAQESTFASFFGCLGDRSRFQHELRILKETQREAVTSEKITAD